MRGGGSSYSARAAALVRPLSLLLPLLLGFAVALSFFNAVGIGFESDDARIRFFLRSGLFLDDAFYYLKVAQNIVLFGSPSFDLISNTNGYHPLWLIFLLPLSSSHEPASVLMTVVLTEQLFYFIGAGMIGAAAFRCISLRVLAALGMIALATLPSIHRQALNGLETCLHIWTIGLVLVVAARPQASTRWGVALGAALTLMVLSRLEAGVLALFVLGSVWLAGGNFRRPAIVGASILFGVLAVYVIQNLIFVGAPTPVSGAVKHAYSESVLRAQSGGSSLIFSRLKYFLWPVSEPQQLVLFSASAAVFIVGIFRRSWLAVACSGYVVAQYVLYSAIYYGQANAYAWYYAPSWFLLAFSGLILVRALNPLRHTLVLGVIVWAVSAPIFLVSVWKNYGVFANNMLHHAHLTKENNNVGNDLEAMFLSSRFINEQSWPAGTLLGAHNAGVVGYFSRYRVVNMDGLINGMTRLRYIKKDGYDFFPYMDEAVNLDVYIDQIESEAVQGNFVSRGFSSQPLAPFLELRFGPFTYGAKPTLYARHGLRLRLPPTPDNAK